MWTSLSKSPPLNCLDFSISQCRHFDPIIDTDLGLLVTNINNTNINDSFNDHISSYEFDVTYYTDGSRAESSNLTDYAVFSPQLGLEHKGRINNFSTIFEAEALAIMQLIPYLLLEQKSPLSFLTH